MNIKINYGTGVATLPTAALGSLDRATKADIKLLFLLCAEPFLLCGESREACMSRIRERSGCSVPQIEASLAFWRGAGVLDMEEGADSECPSAEEPQAAESVPSMPVSAGGTSADTTADGTSAETAASEPASAPAATPAPTQTVQTVNVTVTRAKTKMLDEIPNYTADELERFLTEQQDIAKYLDECQCIWGGIFNQRDTTLIISLVNTWGFTWDYVLSLLAYASKHFQARDNQGKSLNFVYRTAVAYHKEGILTDEALRQKFLEEERMKDFEHRIRAMFGLGERNLTPKEKKYFSTWLYEYKYGPDIIEMAYNIAVDTKGTPQMNYINGILKNWYEDGLTTSESIIAKRELDANAIKGIKEGKLTPDNAREAVESLLAADPVTPDTPRPTNISRDINILRRLMNLGNRMLTEGETAAFTKWREEYGFRYEIIYYAYQITLENRREYNLPYMDAILNKWHARNLTTMEAVKAYEQGFKEDKQRKKAAANAFNTANAPRGDGSFETEDFFTAAVKRSFGEDFDPTVLN